VLDHSTGSAGLWIELACLGAGRSAGRWAIRWALGDPLDIVEIDRFYGESVKNVFFHNVAGDL
jgi:hypothetical protein